MIPTHSQRPGLEITGPESGDNSDLGFFRKLVKDIDDYSNEAEDFDASGIAFMTHLTSMYWGIRGLAENLLEAAANPFFMNVLKCKTEVGGDLTSRIWLPFSMKPLWAILSDLLPIGYYKKRWYFVLLAVGGTIGCIGLSYGTVEQLGGESGLGAFYLFFGTACAITMGDTLSQGKYSEVAKAKGSSVVSFTYGSKVMAGMIGVFIAGIVNDKYGPQTTTFLAIFFFAQMMPVGACNLVGDRRLPKACSPDCDMLKKDWKIFTLAGGIVAIALLLAFWSPVISLFGVNPRSDFSGNAKIVFGLSGCLGLLVASFFCLPFQIAKINVYLWLCRIMCLSFNYALQQWFTVDAETCPDTPHFPTTIYQSMGFVTASIAQMFAVWLFENYVVHWYAPRAFWVTTAFTCVGALFDIMMVTGFNRTLLSFTGLGGLTWTPTNQDGTLADPVRYDDIALFLFGTQAMRSVVDTLDNLPATLLLSKLVPKGLEVTVFAVLVAFFNLGWTMAGQMGARFLKVIGVNIQEMSVNKATGVVTPAECNLGEGPWGMNGLVWALILGDIVMPLLTIPATWYFIPNVRLDEDFAGEARSVSGTGLGTSDPTTEQETGNGSVEMMGMWSLGVGGGAAAKLMM